MVPNRAGATLRLGVGSFGGVDVCFLMVIVMLGVSTGFSALGGQVC